MMTLYDYIYIYIYMYISLKKYICVYDILLLWFVGWIDTLLSWQGFIPLSRLTYTVYLIHLPVMDTLAHTARNGEIFTILKFVSMREQRYPIFMRAKLLSYCQTRLCSCTSAA